MRMKNYFLYLLVTILFFGCQESQNSADTPKESEKSSSFEMYEMSEMAALMERMYNENKTIKEQIENGNVAVGDFPADYLKIHSAVLTDPSDMDAVFKEYSEKFITAQQLVYTENTHPKENFNNMVNACVECHQKKCSGPIPRIKKLYIK